jgi:hypothetical protein
MVLLKVDLALFSLLGPVLPLLGLTAFMSTLPCVWTYWDRSLEKD